MYYACILSGGQGMRLWPKSRQSLPKQFLKLFRNKSFLQLTFERIEKIVPKEHIYVVTHIHYADIVKMHLPNLKDENIIIEPERKETAACVSLSLSIIKKKDPEAIVGIFPSDHFIGNEEFFIKQIQYGYEIACKKSMVCFGIKPNRIDTNYGYIKKGKKINNLLFKVDSFIEKPNRKKASYLIKNNFLWNSGIYILHADVFFKELRKYLPNYYKSFSKIYEAINTDKLLGCINGEYSKLEKVSLDKGIMEKTKKLLVIECHFDWDDIGSWRAFERIMERDKNGNVVKGEAVLVDTQNSIFFTDKFVTSIGIEDIILVSADDAILICHKSKESEIKDIIQNMIISEKFKKYV